jgi:Zn-dependent peptidase ImmA (M78 family)/transcriptional regulator with XRE-family HTH domain
MKRLNPEMVRLARDSRGMTQTDLAKAADVAQGTISKVELGEKEVASDTVDRLGIALHYPPSFFFMDECYAGFGISILFYRKRASALQRYLRQLQAQVNICRIHAKLLLRDVSFETPADIQRIDISDFSGTPEDIAKMTRAAWKVPAGPVRNLTALIENAGGFVFKFPFGTTDIDAISHWPDDAPPLFFVNSQTPPERARFSLCHELGHMVMHIGPSDTQENEANRFAAAFLMPGSDIRSQLLEITIEKAFAMKPYWRVSAGAIIKRAFDLECMSDHRYRGLYLRYSQLGFRKREPSPITGEEPQLVKQLVSAHIQDGGYSPAELAKAIHLCDDEFQQSYLGRGNLRLVV